MLKGKITIVTGASRGIGEEIVKQFIDNNAIVYAVARDQKRLEDLAEQLNSRQQGKMIPVSMDLRDISKIKELVNHIHKEYGRIDVLVNNAGIMKDALLGMISEDMLQELFEVNVFATIQMTQLAARLMKRKKEGAIINIASIIGTHGNAGQSVYSATKGAVISFTKSVAKELAPFNIRANAVAPGIIQTDLIKDVPEELLEKRIDGIKMKRMGTVEEVAHSVVFLASDYSRYVTGQVLGVDGCTII